MTKQHWNAIMDNLMNCSSNLPSADVSISSLMSSIVCNNSLSFNIKPNMGRKRGRESSSLVSSLSPSSASRPLKIEKIMELTEIEKPLGSTEECCLYQSDRCSGKNNAVPDEETYSEPSWDDTEDLDTDFEATEIKWTYSDSIIRSEIFQKDIYSRWRVAEQELGVSPYFIQTQKKGVTEITRRAVLLHLFLWRTYFDITHECLHLAIYIFDKCLDSFQVSQNSIKDVAAVSLILASKYEEYRPLKFSNVISLELTSSKSAKFLGKLEKRILFEINYTLAYPTSFMFMNYFHNCMKSSLLVVHMTNYILELTLLSTKYRDFGGAFTAHAAICLSYGIVLGGSCQYSAITIVEEAEIDLFNSSGIQSGSTRMIMKHLIEEIIASAEEKHAVWDEYSTVTRCEVSKHKVPNDIIMELQLGTVE